VYEYLTQLPLTEAERTKIIQRGVATPAQMMQVLIIGPTVFAGWLGRDNVKEMVGFLRPMLNVDETRVCDEMTAPVPGVVNPAAENLLWLEDLPLTRAERAKIIAAGYTTPELLISCLDVAPEFFNGWLGRAGVRDQLWLILMGQLPPETRSKWRTQIIPLPKVAEQPGCMLILLVPMLGVAAALGRFVFC
jgi:hypothetical protein